MTTDSQHSFRYVACDIPPGMTIEAWKRERAQQHRTEPAAHRRLPRLHRRRHSR